MFLTTTSEKIRVKLSSAVTANQLPMVAAYVDYTTSTTTPGASNSTTNNTTYVDLVAAPAASTQRDIHFISIQNQDTAASTVILEFYDGTNGRQIGKWTLSVNDSLIYRKGEIRVIDANGQLKQSVSTAGLLVASNNLSDVISATAARANLQAGLVISGALTTALSPADATTYYFLGCAAVSNPTVDGFTQLSVPITGTIKKIYITVLNGGTLGSSETSTISLRLNASTDTTITSSLTTNALNGYFSNTGLSIAVTANDKIEIKWVTPTWTTNPTNIRMVITIYIE